MEQTCIQQVAIRCIIDFGGILLSTISAVVTIGYWFKPHFQICIDSVDQNSKHIKVRVTNKNFFSNKIKDVNCEITLSKDDDFSSTVRTMKLVKPWIVCLKKKQAGNPAFYLFKARINNIDGSSNDIREMRFIRVRLLAPNFLGIKKVSEKLQDINISIQILK